MSIRKEMNSAQAETRLAAAEIDGSPEDYCTGKMTFAESAILTIKILVGFGLMGVALWGISVWKAAS